MGIEVLVVQHGEKVRSAGDPGLTDEGHRQAAVVATCLAENRPEAEAIVASPLRRAQETAVPIAAALGLELMTDTRLCERMNWDDGASIGLDEFMTEWQRATDDRSYQPAIGDSSLDAADRFIAALMDLQRPRVESWWWSLTAASPSTRSARSLAMTQSAKRTQISSPTGCRAAPSRSYSSAGARSVSSTSHR